MADLRALLFEACIRHIPDPHPERELDVAVPALPLATRLPECVPAGLEWREADWRRLTGWTFRDVVIDDEVAELLFMGQAVKVLACDPRPMPRDIGEFVEALHKLADEMGE